MTDKYYTIMYPEYSKGIGDHWYLYDARYDISLNKLLCKIALSIHTWAGYKLYIVEPVEINKSIFTIVEMCSKEIQEDFFNKLNKLLILK